MASLDRLLAAAETALKSLDPLAEAPGSWSRRPESPADEAALAFEVIAHLQKTRLQLIQRLGQAEAGIARCVEEASRAVSAAISAQPAHAAPEPPSQAVKPVPPARTAEPRPGLSIESAADESQAAGTEQGVSIAAGSDAGSMANLGQLADLASDLPVDPADLVFIPKSVEMLANVKPGDAEMEAKILFNSAWQLDGILQRYSLGKNSANATGWTRFLDAVEAARSEISARLSSLGVTLFPDRPGETLSAVRAAFGADSVASTDVRSRAAAGTIVAIPRSGVKTAKGVAEKAQVFTSAGQDDAGDALDAAAAALLGLRPEDRKDQAAIAKTLKEIGKLSALLVTQPDGFTFVRFAVNALHDRDSNDRLKPALRKLIEHMAAGGYQEILVPLGQTFDDSFSPGKYERKRVPSGKPKDKIVGILKRGFLDPKGVTIQKAVVAVSQG